MLRGWIGTRCGGGLGCLAVGVGVLVVRRVVVRRVVVRVRVLVLLVGMGRGACWWSLAYAYA